MSVVRGKGRGLELNFAEAPFAEALAELRERLEERREFYRGSRATIVFGTQGVTEDRLRGLVALLDEFDVRLEAVVGPPECAALAGECGLEFHVRAALTSGEEFRRRRAARPKRELALSPGARSLAPDFAGARADLAARRTAKATVRPFPNPPQVTVRAAEPAIDPGTSTLYHVGTLRGGQSLQNIGNIVVIGDVNPGAELVASGDIVVFGALRGVAHAGAQGDAGARVYAIELAATQLRIATSIAAEGESGPRPAPTPEAACIRDGRITIAPYDKLAQLAARGSAD